MEKQETNFTKIESLRKEMGEIRSMLSGVKSSEYLNCNSIIKETIESIIDGVLIVDIQGKITSFNKKFIELWKIPESVAAALDDDQLLVFVIDQVKDPEMFLSKVRALYNDHISESLDLIEFKDGRIYERFSKGQMRNGNAIGRTWSFRDITERIKTEKLLHDLSSKSVYLNLINGTLAHCVMQEDTLRAIRRMIVPKITESYSIDILDENGQIECLDFYYPDQSLSIIGKDCRQKQGISSLGATGIPKVIHDGKSELYSETSELILREVFLNSSFNEVLEKLKIYSMMLVPLTIRDHSYGVITFMSSNIERRFTWEDLRLAEDVCNRISFALDNALLNQRLQNQKKESHNYLFKILSFLNLNRKFYRKN